jgi:hypothetical protein
MGRRHREILAFVLVLLLLCAFAPGLAAGRSTPELAPGPGRLSLTVEPPNDHAARIGRRFFDDGFLQRVVTTLNSRLTLPDNVEIILRPGASQDASVSRGGPVILGYTLPAEVRTLLAAYGLFTRSGRRVKPVGAKGRRLLDHAVHQTLHGIELHELGHIYTLQWPIPTTSDNEAIADLFSSWASITLLHDPDAVLALANFRDAAGRYGALPGVRAWNKGAGYADLFRLLRAEPRRFAGLKRLIPVGYLRGEGFAGGPWAGLEKALQPIALVPLGGGS